MSPQIPPQPSFQPTIGSTWEVPRLYKDKIYRENTRPRTAGDPSTRSIRSDLEGSTRVSLHGHRSKSSTTISASKNLGFRLSPTSSVDMSTSRYSLDARSISGSLHLQADKPEGLAQSLRAKGSRLMRRQNSKFNLRTLEWVESSEHSWSRGNGGPPRMNPTDTASKPDISEPYNFQHLTHTHARHFQQIDRASHHDLVSEFSAIRASQAPRRELQGIKAECLQSRVLRSEPTSPARRSLISPLSASPVRSTFESPARSPSHHYSQSADYFSPKVAYKPTRDRAATSPISPPSHSTSRVTADSLTQPNEAPATAELATAPPTQDYFAYDFSESQDPTSHPLSVDGSTIYDDYASLPHAVTTPDNSAMTLRPSSSRPTGVELADVPEEDEQGTTSISRPSTACSGLRHAKSFPSIRSRSNSERWSRSPRKSRCTATESSPLSEGRLSQSDIILPLVGDEADDVPIRPRLSTRLSLKYQGFDDCWEDDIDYSYEHAAEADCDFDWDRISIRDTEGGIGELPPTDRNFPIPEGYEDVHQAPSAETPLPHVLPRIETSVAVPSLCSANSAKSSSLSSLNGPATPSFPLQPLQTYALSPQAIVSKETASLQDEAYENLFFNRAYSENLPLQSQRFEAPSDISQEISPRSSRSQISKCNSQESFLISRSSSFRYPRSMDSMSSVPDLVHSKSSRDGFNISAEQAADLAATLKASESFLDLQYTPPKPKVCQSLVKEAARQSMLQKSASFGSLEEEEHIGDGVVVLPSLSHHERSLSAAAEQKSAQAVAQRKRSASSATVATTKNNISYSLFPLPPMAVRSP